MPLLSHFSELAEHECSHLIVTDPDSGRPLAVVSSLDVARALVWGVRPSNKAPITLVPRLRARIYSTANAHTRP